MEGTVRRLKLKNCQLDQAGEVTYTALNAITSAMLNVKGKGNSCNQELQILCAVKVSCKNKGVRS